MKRILLLFILAISFSTCVFAQEKFTISTKESWRTSGHSEWTEGKWSKEMYSTEPDPMTNVIQECQPLVGMVAMAKKITHVRIRYQDGSEQVFDCKEIRKSHP